MVTESAMAALLSSVISESNGGFMNIDSLRWAPLAAAAIHITDEFVWPGGFLRWYQRYRGPATSTVTKRFLININVGLLVACLGAALVVDTPLGPFYWLVMLSVLGVNGVWHVWATIRSRSYSPGIASGVIVSLPLAFVGYTRFMHSSNMSVMGAIPALVLGALPPLWSATYHHPRRK
jgi:hypothetical protein